MAEADLRPQAQQLLPHGFERRVEHIRAGVGVGVNQDAVRHAELHQLSQDPAVAEIPGAGVQLPVGKSAGTALAELDIGGGIQDPGAPEGLHILLPLLHRLAPLQEDGLCAGLGQNQGAEQPSRPGTHHHRRQLRCGHRPRGVIALADDLDDPTASDPAQHLPLVFHRHVNGIDQGYLLPGIHGPADDAQGFDLALRHVQDIRRLAAERPLRSARWELDVINTEHYGLSFQIYPLHYTVFSAG